MGSCVRTGAAWQPAPHGIVCVNKFDLCRPLRPCYWVWFVGRAPRSLCAAALPWFALDRWFLGLWVCHGIHVAPDPLGEHRVGLSSMFVLFVAIQRALALEALSISFSSPCYLGPSPGAAANSYQSIPSPLLGPRNNDTDHCSGEWPGCLGSELVLGLACVVHLCNRATRSEESSTKLKWQKEG
jgi:hypothetical protein